MIDAPTPPVRMAVASRSDGYTLLDVQASAGTRIPPHVRADHDVVLLVLEGELEVGCGVARHILGERDTISLPRDVACRIDVRADARVLCLTVPAGLELLADLVADERLDFDDIAALLSATGVRLLPQSWAPAPVR